MCDFISWVESYDGKSILYLTDQEVFSAKFQQRLGDCQDNDILGHGAIRQFYDLTEGRDQEVRDFWHTSKLPKELAKKLASIEEFDKYWGLMFTSGAFQNDDLHFIISYAPENWKDKAWEQLLKQKPSNEDLSRIIMDAPENWKANAWKQLLMQKPSNTDLRRIIMNAPDDWKTKAWEQLLKQEPSNEDLCRIIIHAPENWKAKAWEQLLKQKPSNEDLRFIIMDAPDNWANKVREILKVSLIF